jgi:chromosome segregation ATPase
MSDAVWVALIGGGFSFLGAVVTVLFVSRRTAKSEAEHRDAETEKLRDDLSNQILARAKDEMSRIVASNRNLEEIRDSLSLQIENLNVRLQSLAKSVESQRNQIISLIEQAENKDRTIKKMQSEIERMQVEIDVLKTENATLRRENDILRTRPLENHE